MLIADQSNDQQTALVWLARQNDKVEFRGRVLTAAWLLASPALATLVVRQLIKAGE